MDYYFIKYMICIWISLLFGLSGFVTADDCFSDSGVYYKSCPGIFDDSDDAYCCGSGSTRYCCDFDDKYPSSLSVAAITGIVIAVIIVITVGICIVVCVCIARRRPGTVLTTTGVANPAVVTTTQVTASPYPYNNPGVAGYSGPAAPAVVVNPPYPVGQVNPPVTGGPAPMANYTPGQPQYNYANPAVNQATVAPPTSYAPPPSYEQSSVQTAQMMTPPTAPAPGQS